MKTGFIAYASNPANIGQEVSTAIESLQHDLGISGFTSWAENDIAGHFLITPILEKIENTDYLVADVTTLNFNVAFEIGYAIGKQKRVLLVRNSLIKSDFEHFRELGIFDTLGHDTYANGRDLAQIIARHSDTTPLPIPSRHRSGRPYLFLLQPKGMDSYDIQIRAAVKKSRIGSEFYDPEEKGRLSASYAIWAVAAQDAFVARFLPASRNGSQLHNIRLSFCSGLARALGRSLLLFQDSEEPVPLDYRDYVTWAPEPADLSSKIADLILELYDYHANVAAVESGKRPETLVGKVQFGSPIAENESRELANYYLETAQFARALNGEFQAITGRKGAGKTAFFIELRNSLRKNPNNIVLDLQPQGFQLLRFREASLPSLTEGTKEHLLTALWEYVLLLEIAFRILRDDQGKHVNDHRLTEPYYAISAFLGRFRSSILSMEGDFAERLERVLEDISGRLPALIDTSRTDNSLTYPNITELLHKCDIAALSAMIANYAKHKTGLWILFDNLDKGWPAAGLVADDLRIVRCLQAALHKIEKLARRVDVPCRGIIFVRGDVYDRLVNETADRGKVQRASLDLTNPDILREIIRRRIGYSLGRLDVPLDEVWRSISVPNVSTAEDSFEFLLDRALMRPRCLLDLLRACQSNAITLNHSTITEDDIREGIEAYSVELATNIDFEIRDVYPTAPEVIYSLSGCSTRVQLSELEKRLMGGSVTPANIKELIELLLYYGVLGPVDANGKAHYIYAQQYELRKLAAIRQRLAPGLDPLFEINPAFWAALEIDVLPKRC